MSNDRPRLFGTDGMRGTFGTAPLDETTVRRLAAALALDSRENATHGGDPAVVLGGDTRDSTSTICYWLTSELMTRGVACHYVGTVPTPCIADRVPELGASGGIVVSASHNPHPDNGIKLIDARGFKWDPQAEHRLEQRLESLGAHDPVHVGFADTTLASPAKDIVEAWLAKLSHSLGDGSPLAGLTIALDTGHGAASAYAQRLFVEAGATVHVVNDQPDGTNINAGCGSTHPEVIAELTRSTGSDLGFSFDGDADRVVLADESGTIRDGDAILYLWGRHLHSHGELPSGRLVATSMTNLGLEVALRRDGIAIERCDVGDREVVATMEREGIVLGGEQSGHIVNRRLTTSGDGLLTALHLARLRAQTGKPLSAMLEGFERFPQLLRNVRVQSKPPFETLPRVTEASDVVRRALGDEGRLVLRYSGTEPLARIMIEGPDQGRIDALAEDLATVIAEAIGQ